MYFIGGRDKKLKKLRDEPVRRFWISQGHVTLAKGETSGECLHNGHSQTQPVKIH